MRGDLQLLAISLLLSTARASAQQPADRFWERPPVLTVGQFDGDEPYVFGRIRDVVPLPDAGFAVLDGQFYQLRWFDDEGRWIATAGREGLGPGEFGTGPHVAEVDGSGRVWVGDRRSMRLSAFRPADGRLEFVAEIPLSPPVLYPKDLCWTSEGLVMHGYSPEAVFHLMDESGVRRSFGSALDAELAPEFQRMEELFQSRFNEGRIACVERFGVVLLHDEEPILRAVSPTGVELWRRTLEDYHELRFELTDRGGVTYATDPETGWTHYGAGLVVWEDLVYVTLSRSGMTTPTTFELRIYRLADGSLVSRQDIPFVLSAMGPEYAYGVMRDPIPQVLVFRHGSPAR